MKFVLSVFVFLIGFCSPATAHSDRIIKLQGASLTGLPGRYQPAEWDRYSHKLRIGANSVTMPECIAERFASLSSQEILVSASWYHDEEIIPSYISFSIREGSSGPAFSLVIELDTLEIIRLDSLSKWMNPIPEECIKQWKVISLVQEPDAS